MPTYLLVELLLWRVQSWLNNSSKEEFLYRFDRDPREQTNLACQTSPELLAQWGKRIFPAQGK
jgi:hypothetical protein